MLSTDGSYIAGSVARSMEIDRTIIQTPRATDLAQAQLVSEHKAKVETKRTQNAEQLYKDKVRRERDERRRHMERHHKDFEKDKDAREDEGPSLDLIA